MNQVTKPNLPIGYWLKQVDNLITEQVNKAQAANGVSRFDWQVINLLKEIGNASRGRIFETMHTFVNAPDFVSARKSTSREKAKDMVSWTVVPTRSREALPDTATTSR